MVRILGRCSEALIKRFGLRHFVGWTIFGQSRVTFFSDPCFLRDLTSTVDALA